MILKPSDKLLQAIEQYKTGDQAAFDTIYYESVHYVTKSVLNVLHRIDPDTSEDLQQDIIQDTYLNIATKLDTLQNPESFLQWAGQIATRNAQRTWNKDVHQKQMEQSDDELIYEIVDEDFIPEDILLNKEKQEKIRKILQELPTNQYLCVVEYFYNGLKETEVAEKLGMPVNTVKTNLSRAKKKLRTVLETEAKKSGVKCYSISGLLILLLMQEVAVMAAEPARESAMLAKIQTGLCTGVGTAGKLGAAGAAAAAETVAAAGATTATASTVAAAAATGLGAKAAAAMVAGALVLAGTVGAIVTNMNDTTIPQPIMPSVVATTTKPATTNIPEDAFYWNGSAYYLYTDTGCTNWDEAKQFCESQQGHLAVSTSEEENAALYGYMTSLGVRDAYFGLYKDDQGSWDWVTCEPMIYTNWAPGEPNNWGGVERYGKYYRDTPAETWNDAGFIYGGIDDTANFLCEWKILPEDAPKPVGRLLTEEEAFWYAEEFWGVEHGLYRGENKPENVTMYIFAEGVNSHGIPYYKICVRIRPSEDGMSAGGSLFVHISKIDGTAIHPE